ncbi:hypothetical protein IFM89_011125 [Coptis chinensis]|uniref:Uncharacterized protein n=1 Tax=Coptis chinensis TaxID=261450 RepID=A0A835LV41_9MAGN|nr:hypothetical protein IFM89_011125 [Coptis chinensis]
MEWRTMEECRKFFKAYGIHNRFSFKHNKNDKRSATQDYHSVKLRKPNDTHTCEADKDDKYRQVRALWVVDELKEYVKDHPNSKPVDIYNEIYHRYGVKISYFTAWKSKLSYEDQYLPPPVERKAGKPKKQRIGDEDGERASSTRKCKLCNKPGHNQRTYPERLDKYSKKRKGKSKSKDTGDVAENEGQAAQGQVPPQAPKGQVPPLAINEGQVPTTCGTKGSRGRGRGGTVGSAKVSESQVSQQVNASQASKEPLNESQTSVRPPTRGRGSRGTRGSRSGQSRGRMYNYFENPTSYTYQPASRATNESSITGQSQV